MKGHNVLTLEISILSSAYQSRMFWDHCRSALLGCWRPSCSGVSVHVTSNGLGISGGNLSQHWMQMWMVLVWGNVQLHLFCWCRVLITSQDPHALARQFHRWFPVSGPFFCTTTPGTYLGPVRKFWATWPLWSSPQSLSSLHGGFLERPYEPLSQTIGRQVVWCTHACRTYLTPFCLRN